MGKRKYDSVSAIEKAYDTPDEYETPTDRKKRKASRRQAINRFSKASARNANANATAARRQQQSHEELALQRSRNADRNALRRSEMSQEEVLLQRSQNAERNAVRRSEMSQEEVLLQRSRHAERNAVRRNEMTHEELQLQRSRNADRNAFRRSEMTQEEHQLQRSQNAERNAVRRMSIDPIQRQTERRTNAEREADRRSTMPIEVSSAVRLQDRSRHTLARSRANGTQNAALTTIAAYQGQSERHTIGSMVNECPHCHALLWKGEKTSTCCLEGRVRLATPNEPPGFLKKFVESPSLLRQIRAYNNALGLTSMGATVCDNVAIDTVYASGRQGVYTFRVQGTICHRIGSLLPEDGAEPSFAQVYVYDGDMEHQVDRRMNIMDGLDRTTLKALQMMLVANNPYVRRFLTAGEMAREGVNLRLVIHEDPGTDLRTHNRPTANEVAAIIVDKFASKERDIVVNLRVVGYNASPIYTQLMILYSSHYCFRLANRGGPRRSNTYQVSNVTKINA